MYSIEKNSTGKVLDGPVRVKAIILSSGGATASAILDDSTDGSGTKKVTLKQATNNDSKSAFFGEKGIQFTNGVYLTLTGTGAVCDIIYE